MSSSIRLIVGLGNPGPQYENTRHNVGFWLVRALAAEHQVSFKLAAKFGGWLTNFNIAGHKCELMLPTTFMNLSGEAVGKIARFYQISPPSILIVHDELDFVPGVVRLKKGGGANGHNGLKSIMAHLGGNDFWRLRIGIGKAQPQENPASYVLANPSKTELALIQAGIERAVTVIPQVISGEFELAMTKLHSN